MGITRGLDAASGEKEATATDARPSTEQRAAAPNSTNLRATTYSHVGRRSTPGMPAQAAAVEGTPNSTRAIAQVNVVRREPPPLPPPAAPSSSDLESVPPEGPATERAARPPTSTRPAAPEPFSADAEVESIAQTFDRLLASEVDAGVAAAKEDASARPTAVPERESPPSGLEEVRALFAQLAAHHARPVRDFLIDLRWGEASRDWVDVCLPAVQSLRRAAEKLGLADLIAALDELDGALAEAAIAPLRIIEGPWRERLLRAHDALVVLMPEAFALDMDHAQRETLIVHSLLVQIPEVRKVTLDHLYAVGLSSIAALADARPADLASTAGIPARIAERIVETFRAYRAERQASAPDLTHTRERARVLILLGELEALHTAFERASGAWTLEATEEKKRTRSARASILSQITVLLARLGEVARLREIERLPFDRKLDAIRAWLREAQTAAEAST